MGGHAADLPALPKKLLLKQGWGGGGSGQPGTSHNTDPDAKHKLDGSQGRRVQLSETVPKPRNQNLGRRQNSKLNEPKCRLPRSLPTRQRNRCIVRWGACEAIITRSLSVWNVRASANSISAWRSLSSFYEVRESKAGCVFNMLQYLELSISEDTRTRHCTFPAAAAAAAAC